MTRVALAVGVVAAVLALRRTGTSTVEEEYADAARMTERYTRAAMEIQNLLSWWKALTEVEKKFFLEKDDKKNSLPHGNFPPTSS